MCPSSHNAQKALIISIANANIDNGISTVDNWLNTHGLQVTLKELIFPVIENFSRMYFYEGCTNLTQGYVFTTIIEQALVPFADALEWQIIPSLKKGPIVLGNIEGDFHALGRKMVGAIARLHHWKVIDLGTNVLASEFVDAAVEHNATIIGVSAMTFTNAKRILEVRQLLCQNHLEDRIRLAVGGAIFVLQPELVEDVGGDGTARNALEAIELFEELDKFGTACEKSSVALPTPKLVLATSLAE